MTWKVDVCISVGVVILGGCSGGLVICPVVHRFVKQTLSLFSDPLTIVVEGVRLVRSYAFMTQLIRHQLQL
jgi:hypothetical protein